MTLRDFKRTVPCLQRTIFSDFCESADVKIFPSRLENRAACVYLVNFWGDKEADWFTLYLMKHLWAEQATFKQMSACKYTECFMHIKFVWNILILPSFFFLFLLIHLFYLLSCLPRSEVQTSDVSFLQNYRQILCEICSVALKDERGPELSLWKNSKHVSHIRSENVTALDPISTWSTSSRNKTQDNHSSSGFQCVFLR